MQNCGDRKQISGCWGLRVGAGVDLRWHTRLFVGDGSALQLACDDACAAVCVYAVLSNCTLLLGKVSAS